MNTIRIISSAALSLLLGIASPAYAQHEQQGEKQDHPQQQDSKHEQAKPEQQHQRQDQSKQQQHAQQPRHGQEEQQQHAQQHQRQDQNKQQQHAQQQNQQDQNKQQEHAQQQRHDQEKQQQHAQQQQRQDQNNRQQRAQQRGNEHLQRTQEQQRVQYSAWQEHRSQRWDSDDRYRGYFGRDHGFRIYGLPFLVVGGYPRFQYQGYWISLVDPWPENWGNDWYDNDDVYVTYVDNGYYMYNRRYPNVGIAISISM